MYNFKPQTTDDMLFLVLVWNFVYIIDRDKGNKIAECTLFISMTFNYKLWKFTALQIFILMICICIFVTG